MSKHITQWKDTDVPCTVEDEEPHCRAQRRGKELVLEPGEVRVEPGACKHIRHSGQRTRKDARESVLE